MDFNVQIAIVMREITYTEQYSAGAITWQCYYAVFILIW